MQFQTQTVEYQKYLQRVFYLNYITYQIFYSVALISIKIAA